MKSRFRLGFLCLLGLAGLAGSAAGVMQLRNAMSRSQDLYRIDTVASHVESDLEFYIQESRRAFLYALSMADPNQQLPYVDAAREAADRVNQNIARIRDLHTTRETAFNLQQFETAWDAYGKFRDEIVARILSSDQAGALDLEQGEANGAFTQALDDLHALKRSIEDHARKQSDEVRATLKSCIVALAGFVLAVCLVLTALIRANRSRAQVALSLQASNEELAKTQELDRRRVAVLEQVGTHAALTDSLAGVARMAAAFDPGAGAAIWTAAGDALLYQVSSDLPEAVVDALRSRTVPRSPEAHCGDADGFVSTQTALRNGAQDVIGLLAIFHPPTSEGLPPQVISQMAQLGSIAIENSSLYEVLAFQAQHDVLTGLPNRLLFQDRVQQAIRLAQRNHGQLAVLWLDIDRFKQINDTLGHRAGDELLAEVARRLQGAIRESDTVARIGGDEFVVLASAVDSGADAVLITEKIMKALRAPIKVGGHELRISASVGIGMFPEHGGDPAALMRNADLAMYQAKRSGRDALQTFLPQFGVSQGRRLQVEQELRAAMGSDEFYLEYQPLIDRFDNLDGFEALMRWDSPSLGKVSPSEFIPIAEESGLIGRIGEWVMRTACRDGARWMQEGMEVPRIAVNASGRQFTEPDFGDMVYSALAESGFPAGKLEIEVTETALVNHIDRAVEQIARLRDLGVKFAIDDFGTGYSSLNQLRTLPVDYVKVDRSFIKDLYPQSDSSTLVRGIIGLAHNLQLRVVAEGVETQAQLSLLRSMGCDVSQGFFLHRPMSADAAQKLMKQHALEPAAVA
jgi:diguanylate cyclase (GGDEF)-like protein